MAKLTIIGRDGAERTIDGRDGWSVMENIRDAGFEELLALCGGNCSCATCHVHVEETWLEALPPMGVDEDDLLGTRSEEHTSELQSRQYLVCRLLLEKKKY